MIYVVELPSAGDPRAWFAYDEADFARKVVASDALEAWEIHDQVTPRGLLDALGHDAVNAAARAACPAVCALGDDHGWDAPLYRADHLLGRGVLSADAVSERDAMAAALAARGGECLVYWNDSDAVGAFEGGDPRLATPERWRARHALYQQLLALEVLADDN